MTNREVMQQALVALECMIDDLMYKDHKRVIDISNVAITALRTALEKSEPPPEWETINNIISEYGLQAICFVAEWKAAQRPWVGLTPEEVLDLFDVNNVYGSKWIEFARTVEATLKKKNT